MFESESNPKLESARQIPITRDGLRRMHRQVADTSYVLVTPAKNEEDYIEKTLASVVSQSILPRRWVIVSDGSTDRTDEIVAQYAARHNFIRLVRRESGGHSFGSKVHAFRVGCEELHDVSYDFIGNLDADIELPNDYYEHLFRRFADDDQLGLSGGTRLDLIDGNFVKIRFTELDIGGAYQLFRRECYEEIGGYMPLEMGGVDTVAGIMSRYRGWRVRGFPDIVVRHCRPTGIAQGNVVRLGFRTGMKRFLIGYHPLFECAKLMRVRQPIDMVHNFCELAGFTVASVRGFKRQVPDAMVKYLRAEQLGRLKQIALHFHDPASGKRDKRAAD